MTQTVPSAAPDADRPRSMQEVLAVRDQRQADIRAHAFYRWLEHPRTRRESQLGILPAMAFFVMTFRDLNRWVLRFPEADDEFKGIINGSTVEDETHSRLFLEDWRKLHLDDKLGWKPSDVLWWLFLSEDMEVFRRLSIEFMKVVAEDGDDPLIRFAHTEMCEACGHVFFERVAPLADQIGRSRGVSYRYFGGFHLELETGHVLESEDVFQRQLLTEAQFERAARLVEEMSRIFEGIHDGFTAYARRYIETATLPGGARLVQHTGAASSATSVRPAAPARFDFIHATQRPVQEHLEMRVKAAASHPVHHWLATSPLPAHKKLQRIIPLWSFGIFGHRDLNRYVFKYDRPRDELERLVNSIAHHRETHGQLFLRDWLELQLDEVLRWPASDTLEFLFLDYFMEHHRGALMQLGLLGLKHRDALERLWFIEALEASSQVFFESIKAVASSAEQEQGMKLDYLAQRHAAVHSGQLDEAVNFRALAIREQHRLDSIHLFIDTVFDALDRDLGLSLEAARHNKFAVRM